MECGLSGRYPHPHGTSPPVRSCSGSPPADNVQSHYGYPGCGLAPQDGHKTRPRRDPEMDARGMNDQRDLEGLSALVTGATSGIGRAAAEELGRRGAEIVVHGRDADRGSAGAGTITPAGGKAPLLAAPLTPPAPGGPPIEQGGPGRRRGEQPRVSLVGAPTGPSP